MRNTIVIGTLGVAISFGMLAFGYLAGSGQVIAAVPPATERTVPSMDKGQIEQIVRNYLLENPELLVEVQTALETRQREAQRIAQTETIRGSSDRIFDAEHDGIVGNPDASVTVVEFFDYNCGYCKRALEDMQAMTAEDSDLRFVLKEFPILGPDSKQAHIVSMAFRALAPEKYAEFHTALLGARGRANEAAAIRVALSLGVDEAALREEMKNPAIEAAFNETYDLANKLSVTGTPSYVIGDEVVFGAQGQETLTEAVRSARESEG